MIGRTALSAIALAALLASPAMAHSERGPRAPARHALESLTSSTGHLARRALRISHRRGDDERLEHAFLRLDRRARDLRRAVWRRGWRSHEALRALHAARRAEQRAHHVARTAHVHYRMRGELAELDRLLGRAEHRARLAYRAAARRTARSDDDSDGRDRDDRVVAYRFRPFFAPAWRDGFAHGRVDRHGYPR